MSPLFPRWTNTVSRLTASLLLATPAVAIATLMIYVRTPLVTNQFRPLQQPVQFDHRHHVGDDGIDCRYCHTTVETAPSAGIPSTGVCLNCHSQIWNKSPLLGQVREAYFNNKPIEWVRVHNLPDFVYFNHSIHVNKGVGCVTCHGRVDQMPAIEQAMPLTMGWCVECHRSPEQHLRPLDQITSMSWVNEDPELGKKLAQTYDVHSRTSCTTCHR
jgi:hypothetical protein